MIDPFGLIERAQLNHRAGRVKQLGAGHAFGAPSLGDSATQIFMFCSGQAGCIDVSTGVYDWFESQFGDEEGMRPPADSQQMQVKRNGSG
jgi:hypothetical protein